MPWHSILLELAAVLLFLAMAIAWPRRENGVSAFWPTLCCAGLLCWVVGWVVPR